MLSFGLLCMIHQTHTMVTNLGIREIIVTDVVPELAEINSKIDQLATDTSDSCCSRIPISTNGFTITQPGSYYLTQSINGAININANDVTFDLNGYTITGDLISGGIIITNVSNVIVFNGRVIATALNQGVQLNSSTQSIIENLKIIGFGIGILNESFSQNNYIANNVIYNCSVGISVQGSNNVVIENNLCYGCSSGITTFSTLNVLIIANNLKTGSVGIQTDSTDSAPVILDNLILNFSSGLMI